MTALCQKFSCGHGSVNFVKNRSITAKVMGKSLRALFLWPTVYCWPAAVRHSQYQSSRLFCGQPLGGRISAGRRPSVCRRRLLSVTLCIVAKRCVLEQKLLLRAYRKSYMKKLYTAVTATKFLTKYYHLHNYILNSVLIMTS